MYTYAHASANPESQIYACTRGYNTGKSSILCRLTFLNIVCPSLLHSSQNLSDTHIHLSVFSGLPLHCSACSDVSCTVSDTMAKLKSKRTSQLQRYASSWTVTYSQGARYLIGQPACLVQTSSGFAGIELRTIQNQKNRKIARYCEMPTTWYMHKFRTIFFVPHKRFS